MLFLHKSLQKIKSKSSFLNSFYVARITLIPKPLSVTEKEKIRRAYVNKLDLMDINDTAQ